MTLPLFDLSITQRRKIAQDTHQAIPNKVQSVRCEFRQGLYWALREDANRSCSQKADQNLAHAYRTDPTCRACRDWQQTTLTETGVVFTERRKRVSLFPRWKMKPKRLAKISRGVRKHGPPAQCFLTSICFLDEHT